MVEVTHGPYMVDNNIFASKYNFDNVAQGGAYIQNLCMGIMRRQPVLDRSTPYHYAHTTDIAGVAFVYSGDDRLYQNIFAGNPKEDEEECGTLGYRGHPVSMKEYTQTVVSLGNEDHEQFNKVRQPVYINENVYINGAKAFEREERKQIIPDYLEVDFREEPEESTWIWRYLKRLEHFGQNRAGRVCWVCLALQKRPMKIRMGVKSCLRRITPENEEPVQMYGQGLLRS